MATELTRLGVVIDPSGAQRGARQATDAADKMAKEMVHDLDQVEKESRQTGATFDQTGKRIATSAKRATKAVDKQAKGNKKLGQSTNQVTSGFGSMMDSVIRLLQPLGLMNSGFGRLVNNSFDVVNGIKGIGGQTAVAGAGMAAAGTGAKGLAGGLSAAAGMAKGLLAAIAPLLPFILPLIAAVVAFKAAMAGFTFIKGAIKAAAELEQYHVRLQVLTGSAEAADVALRRMNTFADETPFTDAEVFEAGVKLQAMTGGALATTDALKSIGGAAFVAGKSFTEVADLSGRAFNAIRLGMDFIEPLKTMNSLGLITGKTTLEVIRLGEEAARSGDKTAKSTEQWAAVYADLAEKQEALALAGQTWNGLLSTLSGKWDAIRADFGAPITDALTPLLSGLVETLKEIQPEVAQAGQLTAAFLKSLMGAQDAVPFSELLFAGMEGGFTKMGKFMATIIQRFALGFALQIEDSAAYLGNVMIGEFEKTINWLEGAFDKIIAKLESWNPFAAATSSLASMMTSAGMFGEEATPGTASFDSVTTAADLGPTKLHRIESRDTRMLSPAMLKAQQSFDEIDSFSKLKETAGVMDSFAIENQQRIDGAKAEKDAAEKALQDEKDLKDGRLAQQIMKASEEAEAVKKTVAERQHQAGIERDILLRQTAGASEGAQRALDRQLNQQMELKGEDRKIQLLRDQEQARQQISDEIRQNTPELAAQLEDQIVATLEAERANQALKAGGVGAGVLASNVGKAADEMTRFNREGEKAAKRSASFSGGSTFNKAAGAMTSIDEVVKAMNANKPPPTSHMGKPVTQTASASAAQKQRQAELMERWKELIQERGVEMQVQAAGMRQQAAEQRAYQAEHHNQSLINIGHQRQSFDAMTGSILAQSEGSIGETMAQPYGGTMAEGMSRGIQGTMLEQLLQAGGSSSNYDPSYAPSYGSEPIRRYHTGGTVGSSEQAAILEDGETVLTAEAASDIRDRIRGSESSGTTVNIVNITDPAAALEAIANDPDTIINAISSRRSELQALVS
tara:strand:- start:56121 stop:59189 length:3069 start_codon:yes stop_codon:yes gene_type:complete